jgi:predicted amino acid-binding ACT domain protein
MKFELVGEWKTVLVRSSASLLGMVSAVFGVIAELAPQLPTVQSLVSQQTFTILSIICAVAVPLARIVKQDQLRLLTAAANPQPVAATLQDSPK